MTKTTAATTRQCRRGGVASVMTSRTLTTTSGALAQNPVERTWSRVDMLACTRAVQLSCLRRSHQVCWSFYEHSKYRCGV